MAGSGPTTAWAAATPFSQVSVTGIGDPESSVPAEVGALLSHTTFGAAAVLGDGDGGLLDGGAGDAEVLAWGGAETDGAEVRAVGGAETDGTGVAHPAAMARSTATAPLARKNAPVCPFIAFRLSPSASRSIAPESVASRTCSGAALFRDAPATTRVPTAQALYETSRAATIGAGNHPPRTTSRSSTPSIAPSSRTKP